MTFYKALIWKEKKEVLRSFDIWISLISTVGLVLFVNIYLPYDILKEDSITNEVKNLFCLNQINYIYPMFSGMIGIAIFSTLLTDERKEKTLNILLSLGFKQENIWLTKVIFSCIVVYLEYLVFLVVYYFALAIITGFFIVLTFKSFVLILVVIPIITTSILFFAALAYWSLKNYSIINLIVPLGMLYLSYYLSSTVSLMEVKIYFWLIIILAAFFLMYLSYFLVSRLSKEYLSGLC